MLKWLYGFIDNASWQRLRLTIFGSVLLSLLAVILSIPETNLPLEGSIYDFLQKTRLRFLEKDEPTGIVIIAIDDDTRSHPRGSMPEIFSPAVYGAILEALTHAGAKVVAIHHNLPFSESRMYTARDELNWWAAYNNAKNNNVKVVNGMRYRAGSPILPAPRYVEIIGRSALGFMNLAQDRDFKVRSIDFYWAGAVRDPHEFFAFALLTAMTSDPEVKLPSENSFHIDFRDSFLHFSFADVYQKAMDGQMDFFRDHFKGAIVLIGETSALNLDTHPVPLSKYTRGPGWDLMPAVEIQAHAINTLLKGRITVMPGVLTLFGFFFGIMFITLIPLYISKPNGPYPLAFLPTVMILIYPLAAIIAFNRYVLLPVTPGLFVIFLAHLLYWGLRSRETRRMARTRTKALNLYLDPALTGKIISDPDILSRKGEKRVCTIFFADLEGFTSMSEMMNTEDMVDLVNLYYDAMTAQIERFDGFVDKFVGDSIMAVWGAPSNQKDHAVFACLSALAQRNYMAELNKELEVQGKPALSALIGLNTGQCIAGNIGSQKHMAYTVMGDSVNLASRLVSVNKLFKTSIIASENTMLEAKDQIIFRPLDRVRVVGRKKSINIYEVVSKVGELPEGGKEMINFFERALRHYWARDFGGALARFERAQRAMPDDKPSGIFIQRCRAFIHTAPGEDWDGVTVLGLK
ncbi:MAG: adenylate/guanylate cyclase domain-containing protein [Deltaproteobacteria bacterium]|jgi:class 3 adenylate cyclase/CHASE2 domain-containing sensor protein|nr:adenylate/guanylate cyclase domain-containing protein [Deltaproteobacteria bacterium]